MSTDQETMISISDNHRSMGISTAKLSTIIEDKCRIENTVSIVDASTTNVLQNENISAYGKGNALPTTPHKAQATGILPMSESIYKEKMRQIKGRSLRANLMLTRMSLADTEGFRIRMAYRLIRYLARAKGDLPGFNTLTAALPEMWNMPRHFNQSQGYQIGVRAVRSLLMDWQNSNNTFTYFNGSEYLTIKGVTYLPPPIPDQLFIAGGASTERDIWHMRVNRIVPTGYVPEDDEPLSWYCDVMDVLSEHLSAKDGTELEPHAGIYGLAGLCSVNSARMAWPDQDELILYEDEMNIHVYDKVIKYPDVHACERMIQEEFGISRMEAMDLLRMSRKFGTNIYRRDQEETRGVLIDQIGEIAGEAKGIDLRCALSAYDKQSKLMGLTRTEESSEMQELRSLAVSAGELKDEQKQ